MDVNLLIDKYLSNDLDLKEIAEIENLIDSDPVFKEEFEFQADLQEAITEKDIMSLRDILSSIISNKTTEINHQTTFNLLEESTHKDYSENSLDTRIFVNFYSPMPRLHLVNHKLALKEKIHPLQKDEFEASDAFYDQAVNPSDEELFNHIGEAILEKDIMALRGNLNKISSGVQKHKYSIEQIENYVDNEMAVDDRTEMENELEVNKFLRDDVKLMAELNSALQEKDIFDLRNQLSEICKTQSSYNYDSESVERYVGNELNLNELEQFEDEFIDNPDLRAEVNLYREVNKAIGESDVMALRDNLKMIGSMMPEQEEKSVIRLPVWTYNLRKVAASAAAAMMLLFGIGAAVRNMPVSGDRLYTANYVSTPSNSVTRSANSAASSDALMKYDKKDYRGAIAGFDRAIIESDNPVYHFYRGASLQELGQFRDAIPEYRRVISDKNSMYIGRAEWNLSLCYIKLGEIQFARTQLQAIVDKKNIYSSNAKTILRKMRK